MKLRKHKNKSFLIQLQTRSFPVVKCKGNVGGYEQREERLSSLEIVYAQGNSRGAVLNGLLFGRDRNNTVINRIVEFKL